MASTVFTPSLEGMKNVKSEQGEMLSKPFLDVCKLILPVIDKFGAAMALVKSDIGGNINRLETKYASDPSKYEHLYSMVQEEVNAKTAKASSSCTNGLLWLTSAMDFLVELFRNLIEHPDWTMSQACSDSYAKTLKKWHGWLSSSSFSVAKKLAPDRKKFMEVIGGSGDINADIEKFCTLFPPLLQENHKFLVALRNLRLQETPTNRENCEVLPSHSFGGTSNFFCKRLQLNKMVATAALDHKVKGILKGLRYISQMFENEKEQEMVIGLPTDVKHVAHIGWDGPVANNPTWMNNSFSAPLAATMGNDVREAVSPKSASQEIPLGGIPKPSPSRDDTVSPPKHPRRSRRHASAEAAGSESSSRDASSSRGTRHSRKSQSTGSVPGSESSAAGESSDSRRGRRHHKSDKANGSAPAESPDLPSIPKQKKKERRSRGSADSGSSRSAHHRTKNPSLSDPGAEESAARPVAVEEAA